MIINFDLISDLHIETWPDFDWTGQATSQYCIVAGDIARDRKVVLDTLRHLSECYVGVFYIDGNDEHRYYLDNINESYQELIAGIKKIKNVVYLQDNVVIINGVAILATNGWWCYDFNPEIDIEESQIWYETKQNVRPTVSATIADLAYHDTAYLINSVKKLQTHTDVKKIIIVSHTIPAPWIIEHDPDLVGTWRFNCMGNRHLQRSLDEDTENKVHTWCFGHYHRPVDQIFGGVRYINNCRGRGDTEWRQSS